MGEKVLFVDDDLNLLRGYARLLGRRFTVTCACGGHEGLAVLRQQGPFAVVVADRRMPHMDGESFLAEVEALAPATVRIMLTGDADTDPELETVKEGRGFRCLAKPCHHEVLAAALADGLQEYRHLIAERDARLTEEQSPEGSRTAADEAAFRHRAPRHIHSAGSAVWIMGHLRQILGPMSSRLSWIVHRPPHRHYAARQDPKIAAAQTKAPTHGGEDSHAA